MSKLSDNIKNLLQTRVTQSQQTLSETREWVDKLKAAGFTVTDLETKQTLQEAELERLRMLL